MQMFIKALLLAAVVAEVSSGAPGAPGAESTPAAETSVSPVTAEEQAMMNLEKAVKETFLGEASEGLEEEIKELLSVYTASIAESVAPADAAILESVKSVIEGRVAYLHKKVEQSADANEAEKTAFEAIQVSFAQENTDGLNWVQLIEKNKLTSILNSLNFQDEAEITLDDLKFLERRDDQKYNEILDLEKNDNETDDEFKLRKDELKKDAVYEPSLWESYDVEDNLKTKGIDVGLQYVNIPYQINFEKDASSELTKQATKDLEDVILVLRQETCINFTEVNDYTKLDESKQQYIKFVNDQKRGCDEIIGRKNPLDEKYNHQVPQLQPFSELCQNSSDESQNGQSSMGHYLMHILGFDNEHQRPDVKESGMVVQDDFDGKVGVEVAGKVPILMERTGHNDLKLLTDNASQLSGQAYDKMSIMHWSNNFIGDAANTKIPHMRKGEATPFSATDLEKIKALYKCAPVHTQLQAQKKCHFILNEDASVIVPQQCLLEDGDVEKNEPEYKGEAHVFVKGQPLKFAKVALTYDIQEKSEAADQVAAPEVVAAPDAPSTEEIASTNAPLIERRLADAAPDAATGEDGLPVAAVEVDPAVAAAAAEAQAAADAAAAAQAALELAADYSVTAEEFKEKASEAVFPEEDTSMCVVAKLAFEGEQLGVVCGNETSMEVNGECEKDVKFSYKLDSTNLGNKELNMAPGLTVNVVYEECNVHTAGLVDESSASTITLTTVFLALF